MKGLPVEPRITEYLYRKATAARIPFSGTFELTPVCNMDCKMCYIRLSRQEQEAIAPLQSAERWLALAEKAKQAGMLYLLITGGEPFLYPQLRPLLEGLHAMGLLVSINSNATLLDENTAQWLKDCPPVRINVSLYGASDETYGRLCGEPAGFRRVCHALDLLRAAGITVKLNCSLTPENAADLPKMVEFARERELVLQIGTYMFPAVRKDIALTGQNRRFTPGEAAYYMAYADYLTLGRERFLENGFCRPKPSDPEECMDRRSGCRAGKCSFWITWQGDMTPCGMFPPTESPNVFRGDFLQAWEQVKAFTEGIRLPGACAGCAAKDTCRACAAMVIAESGDFGKVPQYRCDMMYAYEEQWNRVKEELL